LRLLRRAGLHRAGAAHVAALLDLCARPHGTRAVDLGDGLRAERSYQRLRLGPTMHPLPAPPAPPLAATVTAPGRYPWLRGAVVVSADPSEGDPVPLPPGAPLELRTFRPGDRLRIRSGRRKLQDVFTDRKVPRGERALVPLL